MKIWVQLLSSEERMKDFIQSFEKQVQKVASPGTDIEVHGTSVGALADDYRFFEVLDTVFVLENILKVKHGDYDAFVIANSLDAGLYQAREILDIPVLGLLETSIHIASMMGSSFGLLVPNGKFVPRYAELVAGYGLSHRLSGIEALEFESIPNQNAMFTDEGLKSSVLHQFEQVAQRLVDQGAEMIIPCGPATSFLPAQGIHRFDQVPVLDGYSLLIKMAEMYVHMKEMTGLSISRQLTFASPPEEFFHHALQVYGMGNMTRNHERERNF